MLELEVFIMAMTSKTTHEGRFLSAGAREATGKGSYVFSDKVLKKITGALDAFTSAAVK